jgi:hypothetical protein
VRGAVGILVETSETDKIIITEELDLFTGLFHLNVFGRERVDRKYLDE